MDTFISAVDAFILSHFHGRFVCGSWCIYSGKSAEKGRRSFYIVKDDIVVIACLEGTVYLFREAYFKYYEELFKICTAAGLPFSFIRMSPYWCECTY